MNATTKSTHTTLRTGRAFAIASLLALFAGGCAGPQNVMVNLGPYQPQGAEGAASTARGAVRIEPVRDARTNAVGSLIGHLDAALARLKDPPDMVIILIVTDGEENSSREYTKSRVRDLVTRKEAGGWKFLYLGANVGYLSYSRKRHIIPL